MARFPEKLTDYQSETIEKAAFLIIEARSKASAMLEQSNVEPVPEQGWFGSPCGARLDFPPFPPCGCSNYTGDGGPCRTPILVPQTGPGSAFTHRPCGHRPSEHLPT